MTITADHHVTGNKRAARITVTARVHNSSHTSPTQYDLTLYDETAHSIVKWESKSMPKGSGSTTLPVDASGLGPEAPVHEHRGYLMPDGEGRDESTFNPAAAYRKTRILDLHWSPIRVSLGPFKFNPSAAKVVATTNQDLATSGANILIYAAGKGCEKALEECGSGTPLTSCTHEPIFDQVNRTGSDGGSGYWISTRAWSVRFVA